MRIALCGDARSGKNTVAEIFKYEYILSTNDYMWGLAFGDYMKERYYKENPHMRGKPKDREHMIKWSQPKVMKDNNIWVRKLEDEMRELVHFDGIYDFVITDLRQPHEEKWCRDNGFHIVRVHAPEHIRYERTVSKGEVWGKKDLPYQVPADFHIYNDGSLEDLQKSCKKLLQVLEASDKIKEVTNKTKTATSEVYYGSGHPYN